MTTSLSCPRPKMNIDVLCRRFQRFYRNTSCSLKPCLAGIVGFEPTPASQVQYANKKKCEFKVLETEYLGVIISEGSIRMDPIKVKGITEWLTPTKKKELQSFLGFTNFYCHFIKNYSKVMKPMTQLMGNKPWKWGAK